MVSMIRLELIISTKDTNGDNVELIDKKVNAFAEVRRLSGDRASLNGVTHLDNFFEFKVRFTPSFTPSAAWRIIYGGENFAIHSVERVKEKRFYWAIKAQSKGKYKAGSTDNFLFTEDNEFLISET